MSGRSQSMPIMYPHALCVLGDVFRNTKANCSKCWAAADLQQKAVCGQHPQAFLCMQVAGGSELGLQPQAAVSSPPNMDAGRGPGTATHSTGSGAALRRSLRRSSASARSAASKRPSLSDPTSRCEEAAPGGEPDGLASR